MSNYTLPQNSTNSATEANQISVNPWRCISGATFSLVLAIACYWMTSAIARTFANKPIHSNNAIVQNISSAIRTLVLGISCLGTFIFGITALGLMALAIQLFFRQLTKPPEKA
ncbi:MAG: DUF3082 domain-containing protein [Oscillatoriaceae bacterium SKW80]|nr:DUF3082 domain-containing protein [Oscillatoriaceae bacterium SKYG93]MCX8120058.1 DUF3082 domain-containing protein [Oscillatoriaceae bacterium SKW80]MDW8454062.1 DUF3082 domain-containing protein [Oscillatoriaceae cyanobacterium SKYGB_i_bin93]HIK29700.1 DUF3082 domain-containing protein [Oscillatoriaceae cyanobacterium M7585_C2015_266]